VGAVGGPLLGVDPVDGRADPLPVGLLYSFGRLGAQGPHRIGDVVGVPVVLDLGSGLTPGPPTPGGHRHRPERLQDIAGAVSFDRQPGGPALPGRGLHYLPILDAEVSVGLQPAVAALLVLAQLPLPIMSAVGLLGGYRQPTRYPGRLVAAAPQEAKHAVRPATSGRLVGGQILLGLPLVFTIMVVNFIGGYIPYIGAFLGGGLAVIIALGNGGLGTAVVMLVVVLAANLLLENFVEPKVMGRTLDIHPLVVLVVTALGGLLGGIVGLILAVPATVIASNAIGRLRSRGSLARVAERAQPTVRRILS
jgi:hypothetical protein